MGCSGNCSGCSGCSGALVLGPEEIGALKMLGQIPFLPVARKMGDLTPVCLEEGMGSSLTLELLDKKGLISLDYDMPIRGVFEEKYSCFPIVGSMALTARGQQVLEMIELQGVEEI